MLSAPSRRVANRSERKHVSSWAEKCPKRRFYYTGPSEKMPEPPKWGIFSSFIAFLIKKKKIPWLEIKFLKKALKMPCWQRCHHARPIFECLQNLQKCADFSPRAKKKIWAWLSCPPFPFCAFSPLCFAFLTSSPFPFSIGHNISIFCAHRQPLKIFGRRAHELKKSESKVRMSHAKWNIAVFPSFVFNFEKKMDCNYFFASSGKK